MRLKEIISARFFEKGDRGSVLPYLIAALISLAISVWRYLQLELINPDAICYLQSSAAMREGIHAGMTVCAQAKWPLYSWLIYIFSSFFHLSYIQSAYVLNSFFSLLTVLAFMAIVALLSRQIRIQWFAAIVILLSPQFNLFKLEIIRDHGFWAFYLVSIVCLLAFFKKSNWKWAIGWSGSLVLATLFRIEGGIFLLFLPFMALLNRKIIFSVRLKNFLQLQLLTFIILIVLLGWLLIHPEVDLSRLHELSDQIMQGWRIILNNYVTRSASLAQYVLNSDSIRDTYLVLFLMLSSWYVLQVLASLSLVYTVIVIYAWAKQALQSESAMRLVLWGYVIINLVVTFAFLAEHLFLSKRYLMALSLVLMVWVPFGLNRVYQRGKRLFYLTLMLMVFSALSGLFHFGHSKAYITDAGKWLSINVAQNKKIYSNNYQLMYYSQHFGQDIFSQHNIFMQNKSLYKDWRQYDYLALRITKHDSVLQNWLKHEGLMTPLIVFSNQEGDKVVIYQSHR